MFLKKISVMQKELDELPAERYTELFEHFRTCNNKTSAADLEKAENSMVTALQKPRSNLTKAQDRNVHRLTLRLGERLSSSQVVHQVACGHSSCQPS